MSDGVRNQIDTCKSFVYVTDILFKENCFSIIYGDDMDRKYPLSQDVRFPKMWYVRPAKPQISQRIHAVLSEPLSLA